MLVSRHVTETNRVHETKKSSLCPCPHLTVIPAAIPERIKRWRALLVLETKRLKLGALLTELNQTSLRIPQDCYPGRLEVQEKETPLASQIKVAAKRCDQECRVIIAVLRYQDNSVV